MTVVESRSTLSRTRSSSTAFSASPMNRKDTGLAGSAYLSDSTIEVLFKSPPRIVREEWRISARSSLPQFSVALDPRTCCPTP
jgi:hypothetical protein